MSKIWEQFIGRIATEAEKHKVEKGQGSHQVFWKGFINVEGGTKMLHHVTSPLQGRMPKTEAGIKVRFAVCMSLALTGGPSRSRRGEGKKFEFGRQVGGNVVLVCGAAVGIGVDGFHARVLLDLSDECCRRILKLM